MVPELSFHRAVDFPQLLVKYHRIKFLHHLAWTKFAQVATLFPRRTGGMLLGQLRKIGTAFNSWLFSLKNDNVDVFD